MKKLLLGLLLIVSGVLSAQKVYHSDSTVKIANYMFPDKNNVNLKQHVEIIVDGKLYFFTYDDTATLRLKVIDTVTKEYHYDYDAVYEELNAINVSDSTDKRVIMNMYKGRNYEIVTKIGWAKDFRMEIYKINAVYQTTLNNGTYPAESILRVR